jgi:hypothetical protein
MASWQGLAAQVALLGRVTGCVGVICRRILVSNNLNNISGR